MGELREVSSTGVVGLTGDGGLSVGAGSASSSGDSSAPNKLGIFGNGMTAWPVTTASSVGKDVPHFRVEHTHSPLERQTDRISYRRL